MKSKISVLFSEHCVAEKKLFDEVENLSEFGEECKCDDCETIDRIHEGNWKEITTLCLNCGGYVNQTEKV